MATAKYSPEEIKTLFQDFRRFQSLHSWYKHIRLEGEEFYFYQAVGEQERYGFDPRTTDTLGLHWHFTRRLPESSKTFYRAQFGPFLRGDDHGIGIIRSRNPSAFDSLIAERYPHFAHVDWEGWYTWSKSDAKVITEVFQGEVWRYWNEVQAAVQWQGNECLWTRQNHATMFSQDTNTLFATLLLGLQRLETTEVLPLAHYSMLEDMLECWTWDDDVDLLIHHV